MAQINKSSEYFNTVLYTGTGASNSITGVGFQPDWVWLKYRSSTGDHKLFDIVRAVPNIISSNLTDAESTTSNFTSIDSDGFTVTNNSSGYNLSGGNYVAWNWLASNTTASNTQGDITSTVSANTTSGFSIVSYTGTGSNPSTVGHGLSAVPKMIIVKMRDGGTDWFIYNKEIGNANTILLNTTNASFSSSVWNSTTPTSSVFTLGANDVNSSGNSYIAYCFAEKKGFSKFGSFTGNGNADGPFIYTGFKPAMVIIKRTNTTSNWVIFDNKRGTYNSNSPELQPNTSAAEASVTDRFDFLSNGIKFVSSSFPNGSGDSIIYMAFAESPFVTSTGIPTTAR